MEGMMRGDMFVEWFSDDQNGNSVGV